jgi:hypothetical protein
LNNFEQSASTVHNYDKVDTFSNNVTSLRDHLVSDEARLTLLARGSAFLTQNPAMFASSVVELNLDQLTANNGIVNIIVQSLGRQLS